MAKFINFLSYFENIDLFSFPPINSPYAILNTRAHRINIRHTGEVKI